MTLAEFVKSVERGEIIVPASDIKDGLFATVDRKLTVGDDLEDLTAEAFQLGVFDPDMVTWGTAVAQMRDALARRGK